VADTRSRREKLLAMASQTASPHEAEVAQRLLQEMPAPRTLDRSQILGAPTVRPAVVPTRSYFDQNLRVTVVLDADDPAWGDS
jgi:hypothetical protein